MQHPTESERPEPADEDEAGRLITEIESILQDPSFLNELFAPLVVRSLVDVCRKSS